MTHSAKMKVYVHFMQAVHAGDAKSWYNTHFDLNLNIDSLHWQPIAKSSYFSSKSKCAMNIFLETERLIYDYPRG